MADPKVLYTSGGYADASFRGRFTASGVSQTFQLADATAFYVVLYFAVDVTLNMPATVTLTRSQDGGKTWNPFKRSDGTVLSKRSTDGKLFISAPLDKALYRLEFLIPTGMVDYEVAATSTGLPYDYRRPNDGTRRVIYNSDLDVIGDPLYIVNTYSSYASGFSNAQKQRLFDTRFTPLSDADISGDLTLYKLCKNGLFAKVTVPAAAQRMRGPLHIVGSNREIRGEYVDVVSTFDGKGVAVASATSFSDPATVYTPGSRVTAQDRSGNNTGAFSADTNQIGIYGFPTLIEAVAVGFLPTTPPSPAPDPIALNV